MCVCVSVYVTGLSFCTLRHMSPGCVFAMAKIHIAFVCVSNDIDGSHDNWNRIAYSVTSLFSFRVDGTAMDPSYGMTLKCYPHGAQKQTTK